MSAKRIYLNCLRELNARRDHSNTVKVLERIALRVHEASSACIASYTTAMRMGEMFERMLRSCGLLDVDSLKVVCDESNNTGESLSQGYIRLDVVDLRSGARFRLMMQMTPDPYRGPEERRLSRAA